MFQRPLMIKEDRNGSLKVGLFMKLRNDILRSRNLRQLPRRGLLSLTIPRATLNGYLTSQVSMSQLNRGS